MKNEVYLRIWIFFLQKIHPNGDNSKHSSKHRFWVSSVECVEIQFQKKTKQVTNDVCNVIVEIRSDNLMLFLCLSYFFFIACFTVTVSLCTLSTFFRFLALLFHCITVSLSTLFRFSFTIFHVPLWSVSLFDDPTIHWCCIAKVPTMWF